MGKTSSSLAALNLTASDGLPTLTVNWTQPNNTKSAQVYRSTVQGQAGSLVATLPRPPFVDTAALAGPTYWYGIKLQGPTGSYGALSAQISGFIASAPPAPPAISTSSLPPAQVGVAYSGQLVASGGTPPYAWEIALGLPPGMTVSQSGAISGTDATASGSFPFSTKVTDATGQTATKPLSIDVAAATSAFPAWRAGKALGGIFPIPGTERLSGYTFREMGINGDMNSIIDAWQGLAFDGITTLWKGTAGGHTTNPPMDFQQPVIKIDLKADAPLFAEVDPGSRQVDIITTSARWAATAEAPFGRPASRHPYYCEQFVRPGMMADGKARLMLVTCASAYAQSLPGGPYPNDYKSGPELEGFDVALKQWESPSAHPPCPVPPVAGEVYSVAMNPANGDIYVSGDGNVFKWTAATDRWGPNPIHSYFWNGAYVDTSFSQFWQFRPSLVDTKRNRLVGFPEDGSVPKLQFIDLANPSANCTSLAITGDVPRSYLAAATWDEDRDVYVLVFGTKMYAINPDTGVSIIIGTVNACAGSNGPQGRLRHIKALGCLVYLASYASPIQFMPTRDESGATLPIEPPVLLPPISPSLPPQPTGMIRSFDFSDPKSLGTYNFGYVAGAGHGWNHGDQCDPIIDSGNLLLRIPDGSTPNASGSWGCRLSDDDSILKGENSQLYARITLSLSDAVALIIALQKGFKLFDFGTGGQADLSLNSTNSNTKVVVQTHGASRAPITYTYPNIETYETITGGWIVDYNLQNRIPKCLYSDMSGCWLLPMSKRFVIEAGLQIGRRVGDGSHWDMAILLWGALEGEAPRLLHKFGPGMGGYSPPYCGPLANNEKIGRFTIFPFMTGKDPTVHHPDGEMRVFELAIAHDLLPFPGGFLPALN